MATHKRLGCLGTWAIVFSMGLAGVAKEVVSEELSAAPSVAGGLGYFNLLTGDTISQGRWTAALFLENADRISEGTDPEDIEGIDVTTARLAAGYGLTDRAEAFLSAGVSRFDFGEPRASAGGSREGVFRAGLKYRLFGLRDAKTTVAAVGYLGTSIDGVLTTEESSVSLGGGLAMRHGNWALSAVAERDQAGLRRATAGLGYTGQVSRDLEWISELVGVWFNRRIQSSLEVTTGGRVWLGTDQRTSLNFGLRVDLMQLDTTDERCPVGGVLGVAHLF